MGNCPKTILVCFCFLHVIVMQLSYLNLVTVNINPVTTYDEIVLGLDMKQMLNEYSVLSSKLVMLEHLGFDRNGQSMDIEILR